MKTNNVPEGLSDRLYDETVIVAYDKRSSMPNHYRLPTSFIKERIRFVMHDSPALSYQDGVATANYDIEVSFGFSTGSISHSQLDVAGCLAVPLHRFSKLEFDVRLNSFIKNTSSKCLTGTQLWYNENRKDFFNVPKDLDVVMKCLSGARGIGQYAFNTSEVCPSTFLLDLKSITSNDVDGDRESKLLTVKEKYAGRVRSTWCMEGVLAATNQGAYLQEEVENITNEWRVHFLYDYEIDRFKFYVFPRTREGNPSDEFIQCQDPLHLDDPIDHLIIYDCDLNEEVSAFLTSIGQVFGSLDLYAVNVGDTTKFGIFEISTEFGTHDNLGLYYQKLHEDFIYSLHHLNRKLT